MLLTVLACCAGSGDLEAYEGGQRALIDPSRPPDSLRAPAPIAGQPKGAPETVPAQGNAPPTAAAPDNPNERWRVGLIRLAEGEALAVINNKLVHPGQSVDGFRVEKIDRNGVSGSVEKQKLELVMDIRRAATGMVIRPAAQVVP
ncbi:MAG: hypothetical protein H7837_10695 [Magnetococcus sp. MYC-9]